MPFPNLNLLWRDHGLGCSPVHVGTWDLGAQLNGPGISGFSMDSYGTHMGSLWFYMVLGGFIWFLGGFIWFLGGFIWDQYGFLVGG